MRANSPYGRGGSRLEGRTALVTGSARGLGAGIARQLAAQGAYVVIADLPRRRALGAALATELGPNACFLALDVTSPDEWQAATDAVVQQHERVDILINNAGIGAPTPIIGGDLVRYRQIVDVNQTGTFLGISACAPVMAAQGGGSIVNIASIEGLGGLAGFSAYCASKHAVIGLTRATALELAEHHIRVNVVCPGPVDTPGLASGVGGEAAISRLAARVPLGRLAATREVAAVVAFLAGDEASYCTGGEYKVDGGWTAGDVDMTTRPTSPVFA